MTSGSMSLRPKRCLAKPRSGEEPLKRTVPRAAVHRGFLARLPAASEWHPVLCHFASKGARRSRAAARSSQSKPFLGPPCIKDSSPASRRPRNDIRLHVTPPQRVLGEAAQRRGALKANRSSGRRASRIPRPPPGGLGMTSGSMSLLPKGCLARPRSGEEPSTRLACPAAAEGHACGFEDSHRTRGPPRAVSPPLAHSQGVARTPVGCVGPGLADSRTRSRGSPGSIPGGGERGCGAGVAR